MAPRLIQLRPGSMSGAELIRADSLRNATIDPVNVTAPMKTPTMTSTEWMPGYAVRSYERVPADEHRGQADEAVEHRDELGHAGHLDLAGPVQPDDRPDGHRRDDERQPEPAQPSMPSVTPPTSASRVHSRRRGEDRRDQGDGHADHAEAVAGAGRVVPRQPGQGEDEGRPATM